MIWNGGIDAEALILHLASSTTHRHENKFFCRVAWYLHCTDGACHPGLSACVTDRELWLVNSEMPLPFSSPFDTGGTEFPLYLFETGIVYSSGGFSRKCSVFDLLYIGSTRSVLSCPLISVSQYYARHVCVLDYLCVKATNKKRKVSTFSLNVGLLTLTRWLCLWFRLCSEWNLLGNIAQMQQVFFYRVTFQRNGWRKVEAVFFNGKILENRSVQSRSKNLHAFAGAIVL